MIDYIFGAYILENMTTGMYRDSKVIYREYIQNACDQIDEAVRNRVLLPGEGRIQIWLDQERRTIVIEDNATGIPRDSFQKTLVTIADSDKEIGRHKGFRGIGRLCGLAYCRELVLSTSAQGENVVSKMICDAKKMRELIDENARGKRKYTANEVLNTVNRFVYERTEDVDSHFFRVEFIDINQENDELLDKQQVKDYLSFVAPVPYQSTFLYRTDIYRHAQELGLKIDEYHLTLDGEQVFKKYTTVLKDRSGAKYDEIFEVRFRDFYVDGKLLAWMWFGMCSFQKVIPKDNRMRGLRLRKDNIQIGDEDALQKLFKEDRGNHYFVGEVFAEDSGLIPNARRDYFNENPERAAFERELRRYFNDELHRIYYAGSAINSAYKKIDAYEKRAAEFQAKEAAGLFSDWAEREREKKAVSELEEDAQAAQLRIEKLKQKQDDVIQKVLQRVEAERARQIVVQPPALPPTVAGGTDRPLSGRESILSRFSGNQRTLVSKILDIIATTADRITAAKIMKRIEEELQ